MSSFTFVHTTDAPSLSASSAKAMRAHVTKTNFANRRKRIASEVYQKTSAVPVEDGSDRSVTCLPNRAVTRPPLAIRGSTRQENDENDNIVLVQSSKRKRSLSPKVNATEARLTIGNTFFAVTKMHPTDPFRSISYVIQHFAPLMFPSEEDSAMSKPGQHLLANILVNEPAFCEAVLAIGLTYRPAALEDERVSTASAHSGKAVSIVNSRLDNPLAAVSDGIIAAVFCLAVLEMKEGNDKIWGIHIDGLAKMLVFRNSHGGEPLPIWLSDALIYVVFGITGQAQKKQYQKVLDALSSSDTAGLDHATCTFNHSLICTYMAQLHYSLERHHDHKQIGLNVSDVMIQEIEHPIRELITVATRLKAGTHPFLRASGHGILLFLHLSWPKDPEVDLPLLAHDLRKALGVSRMNLCSTVDLLVWMFFLGGVATLPGSADRGWFGWRLARLMPVHRIDRWDEVVDIMKRAFLPDRVLLERVKGFWEEVQDMSGGVCHIIAGPRKGDHNLSI